MSQVIDARGRSCPEPVIMAQQGLATAKGKGLTVLVDTAVAKENVSRFLQASSKQQPEISLQPDGGWAITIKA